MGHQQTSLEAYRKTARPLSGANQKIVFDLLSEHTALCNKDIAEALDWPINSVTPRVQELREAEVVKEAYRAKHPISGRTVIYWEVV